MLIWLLFAVACRLEAGDPFEQACSELAAGVWACVREDSPRTPVLGNTVFVVSDEGVVVFDGGGAPLAAERVIAKIRSLTPQPVTHVVISHWHGDHSLGIYRYVEEFPGVEIVAHPYTRDHLVLNDLESNRDYIENYVPTLRERIAARTYSNGKPMGDAAAAYYQDIIDWAPLIGEQVEKSRLTEPTRVFGDELILRPGGREIRILHLGRANTAGDVVLYLPAERILASGDMVVWPTPYGFGSHVGEWSATLRRLKALEHDLIVPGHGIIQRNDDYVDLLIETLESIEAQMKAIVARGVPQEEAVKQLDFSGIEKRFTGGEEFLGRLFEIWFATPIAEAAFKSVSGQDPELQLEKK
jgi:glyoxylase-like metal-dependent hydrolase (beta-lactamase superfamily II)